MNTYGKISKNVVLQVCFFFVLLQKCVTLNMYFNSSGANCQPLSPILALVRSWVGAIRQSKFVRLSRVTWMAYSCIKKLND